MEVGVDGIRDGTRAGNAKGFCCTDGLSKMRLPESPLRAAVISVAVVG